jgi:formamidopyrimidine-DNA glycosylase
MVGKKIKNVVVHRQDIITPADTDLVKLVQGTRVTAIDRRGKRIVFTLSSADRFYIHLGMTGRLRISDPGLPLVKHTHVVFDLGDQEMRFSDPRRFGGVWWIGRDADTNANDEMGPEPLTIGPSELLKRLSKTNRAIKVALLDQKLIAGLGNIYVDEALHAAGIHPLTPGSKLFAVQAGKLNRSIKTVLRRAIRSRGSSLRDYVDADGVAGGYQLLHKVYGREGEPCRTCKTPIERIVLGGRSTHFCPTCQKGKR